jgi:hypothetical protein
MARSMGLFTTNSGLELAPEICLLVMDLVACQCPKMIGALLRVSKVGLSNTPESWPEVFFNFSTALKHSLTSMLIVVYPLLA